MGSYELLSHFFFGFLKPWLETLAIGENARELLLYCRNRHRIRLKQKLLLQDQRSIMQNKMISISKKNGSITYMMIPFLFLFFF